jgi:hypothetical protein
VGLEIQFPLLSCMVCKVICILSRAQRGPKSGHLLHIKFLHRIHEYHILCHAMLACPPPIPTVLTPTRKIEIYS